MDLMQELARTELSILSSLRLSPSSDTFSYLELTESVAKSWTLHEHSID